MMILAQLALRVRCEICYFNVFRSVTSVFSSVNTVSEHCFLKQFKFFSVKCLPPIRVLFFGTDEFAVENLKLLNFELQHGSTVSGLDVVASSKHKNCAVRKYSSLNGLKILEWPLQKHPDNYDIGLVASFGHLIPEKIIQSFPLGMLNVHASLLPRWRGAAPIIHAIMSGDEETGVSIMKIMPKRFDIGDVLGQSRVVIEPHETNIELSHKLAVAGGKLLIDCLKNLPRSLENAKPQGDFGITYAPKVTPAIGMVKWTELNRKTVYNLWRAICGKFHLTTNWHGMQVRLMDGRCCENKNQSKVTYPGQVEFSKSLKIILVTCADGEKIGFMKIGVTGKKPMSAFDFYNGFMSKRCAEDWYFT